MVFRLVAVGFAELDILNAIRRLQSEGNDGWVKT
jgi:hypothetical protein